jgi:transglutaminase-like putative cysteine protease
MTPSALPLPHLLWLLTGMALAVAPHTLWLPWWVSATVATLFLWRAWLARKQTALPARWVVVVLTVANVAGVYFSYRTIFGRDPGVTLLVVLLALKMMETRTHRDLYVMVFLAYFIALAHFFYSQTIPTAALTLVTVLATTSALVGINAPARPIADNLKTSGWMLIQAGPIMLLLFFLFPRVQGPLWGVPQDAFSGLTGLSDTMSPGTISQLSQSDAIAFRVKFEGASPPRNQLYWRGPVFWDFDGRTWRPGPVNFLRDIQYESSGTPLDYEVTLEPHNRDWLFALEMPARVPSAGRLTRDYQLLSLQPVRARIRYTLSSYPNYRATGGAGPRELAAALALPPEFNPRARALAREWRRTLDSDAAIVRQAISFIRGAGLEYTLLPPLLGRHSVDEFLFDTRQGFCEHFASSFVFLLRAAGVPARIVTGYQGGDLNPIDGYMVVRQSDAHAWTEVWLAGNGWMRVDPTAAAVPVRVESGITAAAPRGASLTLLTGANIGWLRAMRYNWDALANQWNQRVLGYNPDRQREMLSWLGVPQPDWQTMAMMLFWGVAGVLLATALWLVRGIRRDDPVQRAWLRFCDKLRRAGLARASTEGPLDYASRVTGRLPSRAGTVRAIAELYVDLRYGPRSDRHSVSRLRHLVRDFRP